MGRLHLRTDYVDSDSDTELTAVGDSSESEDDEERDFVRENVNFGVFFERNSISSPVSSLVTRVIILFTLKTCQLPDLYWQKEMTTRNC